MTGYLDIEPHELERLMSTSKIQLIDVRAAEEIARGMLPNAQHIPLHLLPLKVDELAGEMPLVFYCRSGMRSAQACEFISSKMRGHVYNLAGGILAWGGCGLPIVTP